VGRRILRIVLRVLLHRVAAQTAEDDLPSNKPARIPTHLQVLWRGRTAICALDEIELGSMRATRRDAGAERFWELDVLRTAGSLEEPTSGEVRISGASLSSLSRNDKTRFRRRTIRYAFQDFNVLPGLTAAEKVALSLELDGISVPHRD